MGVIDLSDGRVGWIDLDRIPEEVRSRGEFGGFCGACLVGEYVAVGTQSDAPVLALVDPRTGQMGDVVPLRGCKDTHSLLFYSGYVYIVSTGTNEIYRIAVQRERFGEQELFWRYPGVRYDRDEVHLNGITVTDGRFIACCFGPRKLDGSWDAAGSVFYLDSGEAICSGLNQPHTPLVVGDRLVFAESAASKVFMYARTTSETWKLAAELPMRGYTRGLAFQGNWLLVGISSSRGVSRSRKTVVSIAAQPSAKTTIIHVNFETLLQEVAADISSYGREVYDIIPVPQAGWLSPPFDAVVGRVNEMEVMVDRNVVHTQALQSQLNEAHRTASGLQNELEMTRQTISWRVTAPLRSGRKALDFLIARFRNPPRTSISGRPGPGAAASPRDNVESGCSGERSA